MYSSSSPMNIILATSSEGVALAGSMIGGGDVGIAMTSLASLMIEDLMSPPMLELGAGILGDTFQSLHEECVSLLVVTPIEDDA